MSVTAPQGFRATGGPVGIKPGERADVAIVVSELGPVPAAGVFTTNRAAAAPVELSRRHLQSTGGTAAGIVLNSGCANAATGRAGEQSARRTAAALAGRLSVPVEQVLVCSTGLIGLPLDIEAMITGLPRLIESLGSSERDGRLAAEAIMTTDTHPKEALVRFGSFSVGGMVKGAGMIAPNLATMLAVITTDAGVDQLVLQEALRTAVGASFNELIVDGCTSTNDSVIALSSGLGGPCPKGELTDALVALCESLAEQLADDAEGTTRVARINVVGARGIEDARLAARRVAGSLLVKTSLFGADPYWGRVLSELGASGAAFELSAVKLSYGPTVVFDGEAVAFDRSATVSYLSGRRIEINCDLRLGDGRASVLTTDLGHGYIDENMRTS